MAKESKTNNAASNDEIDLGQLLTFLSNISIGIFNGILSLYIYFKRNIFWLVGAVILGFVIGFTLNRIALEVQRIDVIVTPNVASTTYLYDVITEVKSDLKAKDTIFFQNLGIDIAKLEGFDIEINPLRESDPNTQDSDMKFLELLKDFNNSEAIDEILKSELQDKTTKDQRISFYFLDKKIGVEYARILMNYINSNSYYLNLLEIYNENAQNRILLNDSLVKQIDVLIDNYTKKMLKEQSGSEGRLILENQEPLNIPSLFSLKNQLIRDTEAKKVELEKRKEAVTILNFGKAHKHEKPFIQRKTVLFPLAFIGAYFLISFIGFLNKKAKEKNS